MKYIIKLPGLLLILLIRIYQYTLSPYIGRSCRYTPTCSVYSIEAIKKTRCNKKVVGWQQSVLALAIHGVVVVTILFHNEKIKYEKKFTPGL